MNRDPLAGQYTQKRYFRDEFIKAQQRLAPLGGRVVPGTHDYEAFIYEGTDVRLIFYPHTVKRTLNQHIRVRVSGPPELGGQDGPAEGRAMARLHQAAHDWFPGALQAGAQQRWRGARLQVPDQRPLIGPSGAPGVWLNAGHGSWDWTLAAGAAQLLGALLAQRDPGLDPQPLLPTRLR